MSEQPSAENDAPDFKPPVDPRDLAIPDLTEQERDDFMAALTAENGAGCRLGYTEYDGARYCHEHGGFLEPGVRSLRCDLAPCLRCGFDPKRFEPRPEKHRGAARWHLALHESGRVLPPAKP